MRLISTAPESCNTISCMNPEETPSPSQSQMDNASRAKRLQQLFEQWAEEDAQLSDEEADRLRLALAASSTRACRPAEGTMPLVLSDEQRRALAAKGGPPLQLVDEETGQFYYIISTEQYAVMRANSSGTDFDPREAYSLMSKAAGAAGWDDPAMDVYDNYDEEHEKRSL